MENNVHLTIPLFENRFEDGKEVVFYLVTVEFETCKWQIAKRYKEFDKLNENLKKNHAGLPPFPGKSFFPLKNKEDIEKRRKNLETFSSKLSQNTDLYSDKYFLSFFELSKHRPDSVLNQITKKGQISHSRMGFREVYFSRTRKFYFAALSTTQPLARVNSYLNNINLPWDNKEEQVESWIGTVEAWARVGVPNNEYFYEMLWGVGFQAQAICLGFSETLRKLVVGLDNGVLVVIHLSDENPKHHAISVSSKVHSGRVMRLEINDSLKQVYSIGEDKSFKVFDIKQKTVMSELYLSQKKLTEMVVDFESKIAYVSDRGGSIHLVGLGSNPPNFLRSCRVSADSSIRSFTVDFDIGMIFCACLEDGKVLGVRITNRLKGEIELDNDVTIKGAPSPRFIKYSADRKEIYIGHKDGLFSVVRQDLNSHWPVFSMKIHSYNINCIQVMHEDNILITSSGDKTIKVTLRLFSFGSYLKNGKAVK